MDLEFRPPNVGLSSVALSLATFMQVLDTTIANVSLPTITGNLGANSSQSTWVITSFAVSNAIALPLTGYLIRRFGEVRLFFLATVLFSLTSFMCGISQSMGMLILFRALQGAVAGPIYPVTQSLMISIYPQAKRGLALAIMSSVTVVAPIVGPIMGGWLTDNYSWPWIFFINVPIGIFAALVVGSQLRGKPERTERPRLDYVGLITLIIGIGMLQVVLDKGNEEDWFNSSFIIIGSIVSAVSLAIFVIWELTDAEPIVKLKMFRHRNFATGTVAYMLGYAAFFSIMLLVPLWMQRNLDYTATWAGLATAPMGVLPVLLTVYVGRYATRVDLRLLAALSFVVMGLAAFMRSDFYMGVDFYHVAGVQLFMGLGMAIFFMPIITIVLSDLSGAEIGAGVGLATSARNTAGSFASSITYYLWDRRAAIQHARLTEHITAYDPATHAALGSAPSQMSFALLNETITLQSYQIAFNEIMWALGWLFMMLVVVIWWAKPPFVRGAPAGGGAH